MTSAAGLGFILCLQELLEHGASLEVTSPGGHTPLYLAAHYGKHTCARELCAMGARAPSLETFWDGRIRALLEAQRLKWAVFVLVCARLPIGTDLLRMLLGFLV